MYKCKHCDYKTDRVNSFTRHYKSKHDIEPKKLYIMLCCANIEPTCACGCNASVKFHNFNHGFSKYKPGHQSRVKNNWGHNKEAQKKSQDKRREMFESGEADWIWCKGKSKETDVRVQKMSEKVSKTIMADDKERKARSIKMRKGRLDKTIPNLYGPAHPAWKGGTSSVTNTIRGNSRFHKLWKFPKLKAADFKCTQCGSSFSLCVHHDKDRMCDIIRVVIEQTGYDAVNADETAKSKICNAITDYHVEKGVSGIVLCYSCHADVHADEGFVMKKIA